jgi:hypothetical protein
MTGTEKKIAMAFILGRLHGNPERNVHLGDFVSEWEGFILTAHSIHNGNDSYALYVDGPFGREKEFTRALTLYTGWDFNHSLTLFISAIEMLKAEQRRETA